MPKGMSPEQAQQRLSAILDATPTVDELKKIVDRVFALEQNLPQMDELNKELSKEITEKRGVLANLEEKIKIEATTAKRNREGYIREINDFVKQREKEKERYLTESERLKTDFAEKKEKAEEEHKATIKRLRMEREQEESLLTEIRNQYKSLKALLAK